MARHWVLAALHRVVGTSWRAAEGTSSSRCPRTHTVGFLFQPGLPQHKRTGPLHSQTCGASDKLGWFWPARRYMALGPFSLGFATSHCRSSQAEQSQQHWGSLQAQRDGCLNGPREKWPLVETSEPLLIPNDPSVLLFGADHKATVGGRDANGPDTGEGKAQRAFAKGFLVSPVVS